MNRYKLVCVCEREREREREREGGESHLLFVFVCFMSFFFAFFGGVGRWLGREGCTYY